mgnify:CR=1 FL=1
MPVVATMTLMALRERSQANFPQPFTDPRELRARLEDSLANAADGQREQAFAIVDAIEQLMRAQRDTGKATLARYVDNLETRYFRAEELEAILTPMEQARREGLVGIIDQREALRRVLTEAQWEKTFGA